MEVKFGAAPVSWTVTDLRNGGWCFGASFRSRWVTDNLPAESFLAAFGEAATCAGFVDGFLSAAAVVQGFDSKAMPFCQPTGREARDIPLYR